MTEKPFRHLSASEYLGLSLAQRVEYIKRLTDELKADIDRSGSHNLGLTKSKAKPKR